MKIYAEELRSRITESAPEEFIISTVRVSDVLNSTQRFFDNNFRGSVMTENTPELFGYAEASVDGIAYFFKLLLNMVFGESVLRVNMDKADGKFFIKTKWRHSRDISESDLFELENTARISGFTFEFSKDGDFDRIYISTPLKIMSYFPVYAVSEFKMYTAYVRVFSS